MTFEYVEIEEAMQRSGLRMVVVGDVPSGWGEAAKGILHVKRLPWVAVRLRYDSDLLRAWAPGLSGPALVCDDERARSGWAEILLAAERLAPEPALLPVDAEERALAFGMAHEICGEAGLGWARRLHLVHLGLRGEGGFPGAMARYLGKKYGYREQDGDRWGARTHAILRLLGARLRAQHVAGSRYYLGRSLTAVDIYSAAFMAMFAPLPEAQCAMDPVVRAAFEQRDPELEAALDPILLEHRDMLYTEQLELPLSL